jgi:hypothetical protein
MKLPSRRSINWAGTILLAMGAAVAVLVAMAGTGGARGAGKNDSAPDLGSGADLHGKAVFPQNDLWNQDVSNAPIDPNSDAIIASIGANKPLHADFGTTWQGQPNGIPYVVVAGNQPKVPVTYTDYGDESDAGPFPIPPDAPIEGGPNNDGDSHVLVVDRDHWIVYELWHAKPVDGGRRWQAGSGAVFDLSKDTIRPAQWTSADAAGLPIFPGLVRYDEVVGRGEIDHALRFTVQKSRRAYLPPARHWAAHSDDPNLPPMGMRVRLRADYDISKFGPSAQVILRALKKYGMIVADNGGDWFVSGAPDPRWDDDELHLMGKIRGRDFQVIKMEGLVTR